MKIRAIIVTYFLALSCSAAPALGKKNQFDVSLQGPWILYVDHSFAKWPVLIAMAPTVDHHEQWAHHDVQVTTGDGYIFEDYSQYSAGHPAQSTSYSSHIYCLTLDDVCARRGSSSLQFDDHPSNVTPVQVSLPSGQRAWDWATASQKNPTLTFILPMPDSYSTDGSWHMRFLNHFDVNGINYGPDELHSIGVQLHYKNGPAEFNLLVCESPQPTVKNCSKRATGPSGHTRLANSGTLRIQMKAPETDWACDPHVRRVYPKMLDLVGQEANQKIKVIDPAHGVKDDGKGLYDDDNPPNVSKAALAVPSCSDRCLEHDSQGGYNDDEPKLCGSTLTAANYGPASPEEQMSSAEHTELWFQHLSKFLVFIQKSKDTSDGKKYYFDQIYEASKDLSFPRISQIRWITALVALSHAKLIAENPGLAAKDPGKIAGAFAANAEVKSLFENAEDQEETLLKPPPKNGTDCGAALMLVQ